MKLSLVLLALLAVIACLAISLGKAENFHVLAFYDGNYDAAHINFVREAIKWFPKHATENGYTFNSTNDWTKLNVNNLKNYQVLMFLDGVPHSNEQKQTFQHYIENGGGWIGFHVCAFNDNSKAWPWFHQTLLGTGRPSSKAINVGDVGLLSKC